jgi:hypothetical protein
VADGSSDDRHRPAQGIAHGGGDRRGRGARWASCESVLPRHRPAGWSRGRLTGRSGHGRSRAPAGWATCWPSSWSPPGGGARCAPKLGAPGAAAGRREHQQERPSDARSVAVAALRSATRREVTADDHAAVLEVWSKRHRDLGRTRTQIACRLHAVLCELIPGGISKHITAAQAAQVLGQVTPSTSGKSRPESNTRYRRWGQAWRPCSHRS